MTRVSVTILGFVAIFNGLYRVSAFAQQSELGQDVLVRARPSETIEEATLAINEEIAAQKGQHLIMRGRAYYRLGQYGSAVRDFEELVKAEPMNMTAHWLLSRSYDLIGQHEKGEQALRHMLMLDNQCVIAIAALGGRELTKGNLGKARELIGQAITIAPDHPYVRFTNACLNCAERRFEQALNDLDSLLLDPPDPNHAGVGSIYALRGHIYFVKRDFDRATTAFWGAIQSNPECFPAYLSLWKIAFNRSDAEMAASLVEALNHLAEDHPETCRAAALTMYRFGDKAHARPLAERYVRHYPNSGKALVMLANCESHVGNYADALRRLDAAINKEPNLPAAYAEKAFILATCEDGRFRDGEESIRFGQKACELSNWKDVDSLAILAMAYAESGDLEKALHTIDECVVGVSTPPDNVIATIREHIINRRPIRGKQVGRRPSKLDEP